MKINKNIQQVLVYVSIYKLKFILYLACIISAITFQTIQPLVFGKIIDLISEQNYRKIYIYVLIIGLIYFLGAIIDFAKIYIGAKLSNLIEVDIKNNVLSNILNIPLQEFDCTKKGNFLTKLEDDVGAVSNILIGTIPGLVVNIGSVVIVGIILIKLNLILTLILLVIFPISYFVFNKYGMKIKQKNKELKAEKDGYFTLIQEILSGIKTIKIYNSELTIIKKFSNQLKQLYDIGLKRVMISSYGQLIAQILNLVEYITLLLVSIYEIKTGKLTLGQMVAFTTYYSTFSNSLLGIIQINPKIQEVSVSLERISNLILKYSYKECNVDDYEIGINKGIEFKNVFFKYTNKLEDDYILKNLNFTIEPKKVTAIIGLNGSGKSTILNLIVGLYDNYKGKILIGEQDYCNLPKELILKRCTLVTQESFLLSWSIKQNLTLGNPNASDAQIKEACKMVNLHEFILTLPDQYETKIGYNGIQLSGGQKQRLAIARAILKKTEIYLFDEITSSVDIESQEYISSIIKYLATKHTVVLISHKINDIKEADNVIVIKNGQVSDFGSYGEIATTCSD